MARGRRVPVRGRAPARKMNRVSELQRGTNQRVEINFEVANNEVDDAGNVIRIIKPYNVNAIINRIKTEYQQKTGESMSRANLTELTKTVKVSQGFIGAHYDRLEEWAADNANIVGTALGLPKSDGPSVEFWFKFELFCDSVPPVIDHGTGNTIAPGSKTYGVRIVFSNPNGRPAPKPMARGRKMVRGGTSRGGCNPTTGVGCGGKGNMYRAGGRTRPVTRGGGRQYAGGGILKGQQVRLTPQSGLPISDPCGLGMIATIEGTCVAIEKW